LLGDHLQAFEHLLLATDELGSHVPSPNCRWSWLRVEVHDQKAVYTVDEESGATLAVSRRDTVVFQVNWRLICRMLCASIDLPFEYRSVGEIVGLSQFTVDRSSLNFQLPIYLASGDFISSAMHLLSRLESPCVILRTDAAANDSSMQLLLQSRQVIDIPLNDYTELDSRGQAKFNGRGLQKLSEFRAQHRPSEPSRQTEPLLSISDGTTWASVRIRFIDYETIRVSVEGSSGIFHYTQLGMANSRNAKPVKQWLVLRTFAENHGVLTWGDRGAAANVKKQTQELNKKLTAAFAIEGTPIKYDKSLKGYRTMFAIDEP
jgi:hypothetical protein